MHAARFACSLVALIVLGSISGGAQWLNIPLPGTPRTADGQPNLAAPAPRTADGKPELSGIWRLAPGQSVLRDIAVNVPGGAPLQPWARAVHEQRRRAEGAGRPSERCLPHTVPDAMLIVNFPFKIIQTASVTVILFEEFNNWRQIHTDGRRLPVDPEPAWQGYSVGTWEGDTLVASTSGFKDEGWLDDYGTPHTDAFKTTERFRRVDFGHMQIEFTFEDAKAYTKSWSTTIRFDLVPDTELFDSHCDNERDHARITAITGGQEGAQKR